MCVCVCRIALQVAKSRRRKEPPEEIQVAWKGGLAQQRAAAEAAQRAATEAGKAFGRCVPVHVWVWAFLAQCVGLVFEGAG